MKRKISQEHLSAHTSRRHDRCDLCKENYFALEEIRDFYASTGKITDFKSTYLSSVKYSNKNTDKFWDHKFVNEENYESQDVMTRKKIDQIISFLPSKRLRILDIGIGQGYFEQRLKQKGIDHDLYGFDISRKSINRAKANFKGEFGVGDVLKKNKFYRENFYDAILAIEVIEHIPPDKIFKFYKMVTDSLKKNGLFIVSTPLNEGLRFSSKNPSAHLREYSIPILNSELLLSGFTISYKLFYAYRNMYTLKSIANIFLNRWKPNNIVIKAIKSKH